MIALNGAMVGLYTLAGVFMVCAAIVCLVHPNPAEDKFLAVAGVLSAIHVWVGLGLYVSAAVGLSMRTTWGYYIHIAGAVFALLTCIGAAYTVVALSLSLPCTSRADYLAAAPKPSVGRPVPNSQGEEWQSQ